MAVTNDLDQTLAHIENKRLEYLGDDPGYVVFPRISIHKIC